MNWNVNFDMAAFIVLLALTVHYYFKKNITTPQTTAFWNILLIGLFYSSMDIFSVFLYSFTSSLMIIINYIINSILMLLTTLLVSSFNFFFLSILSEKKKFSKNYKLLLYLPILLTFILVIVNIFSPCFFYFDKSGAYCHGYLHNVLYVFAAFYMLDLVRLLYFYRKFFTFIQQLAIYFYTILCFLAFFIQYAFNNILLIGFASSIAALLVYLIIQNPENFEDKQVGTYNKTAFIKVINAKINDKSKISVLAIQLNNFKMLTDTFGITNSDVIIKQVAEYLLKVTPKKAVFRLSDTQFAVVSENDDKQFEQYTDTILKRFNESFDLNDIAFSLSISMCCLKYPDIIHTVSEMVDMIDYTFSNIKFNTNNDIFYVNTDFLSEYNKTTSIEAIINKAIKDESFEVYYQPIFSVKENFFTSLEALVRLKDITYGFISPDEFIPLSEKNGSIIHIGHIVFSKVCKFIAEFAPEQYGITRINVNLSVVQCMQEQLFDELSKLMNQYNIKPTMINLEITESATYISNEVLLTNMNKFKKNGITFSLDDYGTGFSNITNIIEFPLDYIKIDKSIVWTAMDDEQGLKILQHTVNMIKSLNLKIIAEGVENIEHVDILTKMGCDYFQGFYYSKPIDQQKTIQFLFNNNKKPII